MSNPIARNSSLRPSLLHTRSHAPIATATRWREAAQSQDAPVQQQGHVHKAFADTLHLSANSCLIQKLRHGYSCHAKVTLQLPRKYTWLEHTAPNVTPRVPWQTQSKESTQPTNGTKQVLHVHAYVFAGTAKSSLTPCVATYALVHVQQHMPVIPSVLSRRLHALGPLPTYNLSWPNVSPTLTSGSCTDHRTTPAATTNTTTAILRLRISCPSQAPVAALPAAPATITTRLSHRKRGSPGHNRWPC